MGRTQFKHASHCNLITWHGVHTVVSHKGRLISLSLTASGCSKNIKFPTKNIKGPNPTAKESGAHQKTDGARSHGSRTRTGTRFLGFGRDSLYLERKRNNGLKRTGIKNFENFKPHLQTYL